MGTHLFLSPHLDDAILSCGGVMHHLAWGGERVIIVTAMAGEPREPLPESPVVQSIRVRWNSGDFPYRTRRIEDMRAAQALRAQAYHLPLTEAAFRGTACGTGEWIALYPDYASPFESVNDADDARLYLLETRLPFVEVVAVYAPLGVDEHVDHRLVRDWALALTGSNDAPALTFYEEYPHARQKPAVERALLSLRRQLPELKLDPENVMLTEAECAAKIEAMGCYRSHLHILWNDPAEMERLTRDFMLMIGEGTPAERYWRVLR